MTSKLAKIFCTEEDQVNCPFYFKTGACRYGDKCARIHNKPPYSHTILLKKMYQNLPVELALSSGNPVSEEDAKKALQHLEEFYEDVFIELSNFGEIEELIVCDNIGDHLIGNVFVKYTKEKYAVKCMEAIKNRYYDGKLLAPEFSPVTDFSNAICKQFLEQKCNRGGYCNYLHLKPVNVKFQRQLFKQMYKDHPEYKRSSQKKKRHHRSRSRSKSHKHDRKKDKKYSSSSSTSSSNKRPSIRSYMNSEERRQVIKIWQQLDDAEDMAKMAKQEQQLNPQNQINDKLRNLDLNQIQTKSLIPSILEIRNLKL